MVDTVKERILTNLVETIESAVGPGFGTTIQRVQRQGGDIFQLGEYPGVILVEDGVEEEDTVLGIIRSTLAATVEFGVLNSTGKDWPVEMEKVASDLRRAIRADVHRGYLGTPANFNARTTRVTDTFVSDATIDDNAVTRGELRVEIHYAYDPADETKAL